MILPVSYNREIIVPLKTPSEFNMIYLLFFIRISIKDKAKYALKAHDIGNKYSDLALPRASVLVPLLVKNNELHVLLTVRSMQVMYEYLESVSYCNETVLPLAKGIHRFGALCFAISYNGWT